MNHKVLSKQEYKDILNEIIDKYCFDIYGYTKSRDKDVKHLANFYAEVDGTLALHLVTKKYIPRWNFDFSVKTKFGNIIYIWRKKGTFYIKENERDEI